MPDYRKLYNSAGHSEKVTKLNDFEFRVWIQMRASADDFGVGPIIAGKLQGDNRSLAARTAIRLKRAIDRVIAVGLFATFTHQGQLYYFQPDWQDYEGVGYPRRSVYPYPPFENVSEKTAEFLKAAEESFAKKRKNFLEKPPAVSNTLTTNPITTNSNGSEESARETIAPRSAPLIVSPLEWDKTHSKHVSAFCDWCCFPRFLFATFCTSADWDEAQTLAWAQEVRATWHGPRGDEVKFWRARWDERHPQTRAVATKGAQTVANARAWAARKDAAS